MSSYLASVFKLFLSWWCLAGAAGTALAVICLFRVCPAPGLRRELRLWPSTLLAVCEVMARISARANSNANENLLLSAFSAELAALKEKTE